MSLLGQSMWRGNKMTSFGIWSIEGCWQVNKSPGCSGTSWNPIIVNSSDGEGSDMWKTSKRMRTRERTSKSF